MQEFRNIVIGSGYAGLNAYYEINDKKNTLLLDSGGNFMYHSKVSNMVVSIPQAKDERVVRVDRDNYLIETEKEEYRGENIVIATGCRRENQIEFMRDGNVYGDHYLASENEFDDYILLQYILRLNKTGIKVGYSGNFMKWLGEDVASAVKNFLKISGIKVSSKADFIFPSCRPMLFTDFIKVNEDFMVKEGIYAVGDAIESNVKSGELSMRQGAFVGSRINGNVGKFKPVFITVLDNFMGSGIRIKSRYPWGIKESSIHSGYLYSMIPGFLSRYYRFRKGKMGIIRYL